MSVTRTLPRPRPRPLKTVVIPARRPRRGATTWPPLPPPPAAAERPEADRTAADSLHRKHASAGSGEALAPMKAPQKTPVPLTPYQTTLAVMRERWPAVFSAARPLKIGIFHDLKEALGEDVPAAALRRFLGRWTRRRAYREALEAGIRRIDLSGADAGPAWLSPEEMQASSAAMPGAHALDQADPNAVRGSAIELEEETA